MKKDIHPDYHQTTVTCACGHALNVGSTIQDIHVEICSNCHPFYTGKQKLIDTARRVEKFQEKAAKTSASGRKHKSKSAKRSALKAYRDKKAVESGEERGKTAPTPKTAKPADKPSEDKAAQSDK